MTPASARLALLAAAALFSTGGAAIKACGLGNWQIAGFRCGIAAVVLVAALPQARRLARPRIWLVGCAYAGTLICYAVANKMTTAANTIFLQSTAPLYVMLLAPLLLGEPVTRRELPVMALIAAGMGLFLLGEDATTAVAVDPGTGDLIATLAGLCWALTILGLRWLEREAAPGKGAAAAGVTAGNVIAFAICLPLALPIGDSVPTDWLWILYLGAVQVGLAYCFLIAGLRQVPAFQASLLLIIEPVLSPIWAWAMHGEEPSGWALIGGSLILLASLLMTVLSKRSAPRRETALTGDPSAAADDTVDATDPDHEEAPR